MLQVLFYSIFMNFMNSCMFRFQMHAVSIGATAKIGFGAIFGAGKPCFWNRKIQI